MSLPKVRNKDLNHVLKTCLNISMYPVYVCVHQLTAMVI